MNTLIPPNRAATPEEAGFQQKLSDLLRELREKQERNAALARQLADRQKETDENTELYKRNVLFAEVLTHDQEQQAALTLILQNIAYGQPEACPTPPQEMPPDLVAAYTMNGRVAVTDRWVNDTYPRNYPLIYTDSEIEYFHRRIAENSTYMYGGLDLLIRRAFEKYPLAGKRVVNIGSLSPWFEATLLRYGALPTTLDYNTIVARTSRVKCMTVAELGTDPEKFDAALSISSYEHDGLGAYGDPLDPDGDFKAMQKLKRLVKPGGLLFLNVSIGAERLEWNRARIYGKFRLPSFLRGWTWVDAFGFNEMFWEGQFDGEPVMVLRNDD